MKQAIVDRLDELESPLLVAGGPVPEEEIRAAEQRLDVAFVDDYRRFIQRYGGAIVGSLPVFGLRVSEAMGVGDTVVAITLWLRGQGIQAVMDWAIVSDDGFGNYIGVDKHGRVNLWDHDTGDIVPIAATFEELIERLLDNRLFDR